MTSPTDQREVERRAREAEVEAREYELNHCTSYDVSYGIGYGVKKGYLAAAVVEVIAALEAMVPLVCEQCRNGVELRYTEIVGAYHRGSDEEDCTAAPLHAEIARLKEGR